MQAPGFWQRDGVLPRLLAPLSTRVAAITAQRLAETPGFNPGCPVVCIGNLTVGGQGKTPTVLAVAARLQAAGRQVFCLTRGYGGALPGPVWVDPAQHTAADVGDEPLLLAGCAPTIMAKDRALGAKAARAAGAQVIVMDDGFQNPAVSKSLSLIVVDGATGFGNGRVLPAGPLREPIAAGLSRAQGVVCVGPDRVGLAAHVPPGLPLLHATLQPMPEDAARWRGQRLVAFAGIGRPEKFFETLEALGAELVVRRGFADHRPYRATDLAALRAAAVRERAALVTTAKDWVRLPHTDRAGIAVVPVTLVFEQPDALDKLLAPFLESGL